MPTAAQLASLVGGTIEGDASVEVTGVAAIEDAEPGDLVAAENQRYLEAAAGSQATVIVCAEGVVKDKTLIKVADTRLAFAKIIDLFTPNVGWPAGIDPNCRIGDGVKCGSGVSIGYGCFVGDDVALGDRVVLAPQVYVGDGVTIGADSVLWPRVTVHWGSQIGERVTIHSGAVIGCDGFGYVKVGDSHRKIPHIGKVVIEDDVEIGANVTVDRAKTGTTRIRRGTKIDNLVQIAHNVQVGEDCLIVAQSGLAGSASVGSRVTMGGQSGLRDHVRIGDDVAMAARTGVIGDIPAGVVLAGYPARDRAKHWRIQAALERLPDLIRAVRRLEKGLEALGRR